MIVKVNGRAKETNANRSDELRSSAAAPFIRYTMSTGKEHIRSRFTEEEHISFRTRAARWDYEYDKHMYGFS